MSNFRFIWSRIARLRPKYAWAVLASHSYRNKPGNYCAALPCAVGFSLFTWLGFDNKKLSAEDELIQTIKHCVLFIQRAEYDKAEQLLHVALRQAQHLHHELGITYVYDVMANLALERLQLDKAKSLFIAVTQRILAEGATEDDIRVIHISIKLARISHLKKDYSTAQLGYEWCLRKLNKAIESDPADGTYKLIAMAQDWYGRLQIDCNQVQNGLEHMISALNKMKETQVEQEHIVVQLNDIGTICDKLERYDESIKYLKEAIEIGKKLEMDDLGVMYVNLGRVYLKKYLIEEARKNCGYGWKLGVMAKNKAVKEQAELCFEEIKQTS